MPNVIRQTATQAARLLNAVFGNPPEAYYQAQAKAIKHGAPGF